MPKDSEPEIELKNEPKDDMVIIENENAEVKESFLTSVKDDFDGKQQQSARIAR